MTSDHWPGKKKPAQNWLEGSRVMCLVGKRRICVAAKSLHSSSQTAFLSATRPRPLGPISNDVGKSLCFKFTNLII